MQIFLVIMRVCFLMISMFPAWFIFLYLKYARNPAFLGEGTAVTNLKGLYFMSFYVKLQGKEVLEKLFLVLDFPPKNSV